MKMIDLFRYVMVLIGIIMAKVISAIASGDHSSRPMQTEDFLIAAVVVLLYAIREENHD